MNDLDELKSLLFGAEKRTLDSIAERVEKRETRASDIADVLPEAIVASHGKNTDLVNSLKDPVSRCLQESFIEQPEFYGDALYPVMGPAIRKSIMHALRTFAQDINAAMEHSLSAKGVKWRYQAWRAGVPFGEFVLQQTLLYRVEQAYLISRENGLLLEHVHHAAAKIKDSDAVSAMFTAIQDFVKESFSPDRTGRLETADMGDFTLWAVHGPHALLVCVIRGVPPKSLRADLSAVLERVHFRYGDAIRSYSGDTTTVAGVDKELESCLNFEAQEADGAGGSGLSVPLVILLLALVALAIAFSFRQWNASQDYRRFSEALADTPGIFVNDLSRDGTSLHLRGMRDPLAANVAEVAALAGIEMSRVTTDLVPFQSLEPDILLRRAAAKLQLPDGVQLSLAGSALIATGPVPLQWSADWSERILAMPGIDELRIDSVQQRALVDQIAAANGERFLFLENTSLTPESSARLSAYAAQLSEISDQANSLGGRVTITLTGFTDNIGSIEFNQELARQRTAFVSSILTENGILAALIDERQGNSASAEPGPESRRVEVQLSLKPPAAE